MSTWEDFLEENTSTKAVMFEIEKTVELDGDIWVKTDLNTWALKYAWDDTETIDFSYGYGAWGSGSYGNGVLANPAPSPRSMVSQIGTVIVNNSTELIETESLTEVNSTPDSFYWNSNSQVLYINTLSGINPFLTWNSIKLGVIKGYSNIAFYYQNGGANSYYDPRVISLPSINRDLDPQFYSLISFEGGNVSLNNTDGFFDTFSTEKSYGVKVRIFVGEGETNETNNTFTLHTRKQLYTGYVDSYSFSNDTISISFKDGRKKLQESLCKNYFKTEDFPLLSQWNDGQPYPIAYGDVHRGIAVCIDEEYDIPPETEYFYNFRFLDMTNHNTIETVDAVYVSDVAVPFHNVDLVNCSFQISSEYYGGGRVAVSFNSYLDNDTGLLIEKPIEIIKDVLLNSINGIAFTDNFFDTATFYDAETNHLENIGIWGGENITVIDYIGKITSSVWLLFSISADGRFEITYDKEELVEDLKHIKLDEIYSVGSLSFSSDEYINTSKVKWRNLWSTSKAATIIDESRRDTLFDEYNINKEQEFETVLADIDDARAFGVKTLNKYGGVYPVYSITTSIKHLDKKLLDDVILEIGKYDDVLATSKNIRCEVISVAINLNDFSVSLKLRFKETLGILNLAEILQYNFKSSYQAGAVVSTTGGLYRAVSVVPSGQPPTPTSIFWDQFGKLYWNNQVQYYTGDLVVHNSLFWKSLSNNIDTEPIEGTDWEEFASGDSEQVIQNTADIVENSADIAYLDSLNRQSRVISYQKDATARHFSTTLSEGWHTDAFTVPKGQKIRIDFQFPIRNDSTSWGGIYTFPYYRKNGGPWNSVGTSGYEMMFHGASVISNYSSNFMLDFSSSTEDTNVELKFHHRAYDGSVAINTSHEIGDGNITDEFDGTSFAFSHIIVINESGIGQKGEKGDPGELTGNTFRSEVNIREPEADGETGVRILYNTATGNLDFIFGEA